MKRSTTLVGRRLLRGNLQSGRAVRGKQILATVSQQSTTGFGAGFICTALARMAWAPGWMRFAIEPLQGRRPALGEQILVAVSRVLTAGLGRRFNGANLARMAGGREVGLSGGQA